MSALDDQLDQVLEKLSLLAMTLYNLESDPDVTFVSSRSFKDQKQPIREMVAQLWQNYSLAKSAADQATDAHKRHDATSLERLVSGTAVTNADGTQSSILALIDTSDRLAQQLLEQCHATSEEARKALAAIEAATSTLVVLEQQASKLGLIADADTVAARRAIDAAVAAFASDVLSPSDLQLANECVQTAKSHIDQLVSQRDRLPLQLASARKQLDEIGRLIREGDAGLVEVGAKMLNAEGLFEPLKMTVVDGDERALGPWLDRIAAAAGDSDWQSANAGLAQWKSVADQWLEHAREVAVANTGPLKRRAELRGLLESYQAKAAALGRAEDHELATLSLAAHNALHTAPCDLRGAEECVRKYIEAVNTVSPMFTATAPEGEK